MDLLDTLMRAMIESPDDDLARLAYADALEERSKGDEAALERIAVIRRQVADPRLAVYCEEDRSVGLICSPELCCDGCAYMLEVLKVPPPFICGEGRYRMKRGFVELVRCDLATWKNHGPLIAKAHPLRHVWITDKKPACVRRKSGGSRTYAWFRQTAEDAIYVGSPPQCIPWWLWPEGGKRRYNSPTDEEAWKLLSRWCLEWARKQS